ncbi:GIY-YIG nuclease family protein [Flavisolibacter ginsengisoli]|jgi:putative endonuclease|uniref:Putative endonuclease n=1 Tax=Flavisolibacter ginsengisoli DSM 18119 TaxID=1121884 RepID=A0A1M5D7G8_9BACT|nr:GIY-YIG nuclease family protein [Flavisolibacter ginsengisoli]SHF62894.1 putative endonuclease [Flavisolibacter ginsengisoli DSM 18119]
MCYTVYILYSSKYNKTYVGFTSNLIEMFKSHNELGHKGWTLNYRPWKVIYCEYFPDKSSAMFREKQLKGGKGREWIRRKIFSDYEAFGFISA